MADRSFTFHHSERLGTNKLDLPSVARLSSKSKSAHSGRFGPIGQFPPLWPQSDELNWTFDVPEFDRSIPVSLGQSAVFHHLGRFLCIINKFVTDVIKMFFGIFVLCGSNQTSFIRARKKENKKARGRSATFKPRPQVGRQLTI